MLKAVYQNESDIPSEYRALFSQRGSNWELTGVEGIKTTEDVARVQESLRKERENFQQLERKLQAYGEVTPEKLKEMNAELLTLKAGGGSKPDDIERAVEARLQLKLGPLSSEKQQLEQQLKLLQTEVESYKGRETKRKMYDAVRDAATQMKLLPSAVDDALVAASLLFKPDESGKFVVSAENEFGYTPGLDPKAWLSELRSKNMKTHWWGETEGGGARGGANGAGTVNNPWKKETFNLTEQGKIFQKDPALAATLAKAAGVTLPSAG